MVRRFMEEVIARTGIESADRLVVIWDDANYLALAVPVELVRQYVDLLTSMPPHMYIVPRDVAWAACFRMEGDLGFGFRPV